MEPGYGVAWDVDVLDELSILSVRLVLASWRAGEWSMSLCVLLWRDDELTKSAFRLSHRAHFTYDFYALADDDEIKRRASLMMCLRSFDEL